ncbi:MAG: AbrB/MazE/SpoVT family DNA-binding domain-containing protein, partial [Candidatus Solibacter usitatus]|nr:AbrB/MazE/SpoVT family DNA-binding domain-containing protein [Candidatus Solibacter usitatus]
MEIRKRMGLRAGDRVEFITESGVTTIRPSRGDVNPFEAYAGALGTFEGGVAEINQWVGDLRGR